jgi:hypothetical protein
MPFRALAKNMAARYGQWKLPYGFPAEVRPLHLLCTPALTYNPNAMLVRCANLCLALV